MTFAPRYLAGLLLLCFSSLTSLFAQEEILCDEKTISELLSGQKQQLEKTRNDFSILLAGQSSEKVAYDRLFLINPADEKAVKKRIEQIEADLKVPLKLDELFPGCYPGEKKALRRTVDRLRLQVLKLKPQQRAALLRLNAADDSTQSLDAALNEELASVLKEKQISLRMQEKTEATIQKGADEKTEAFAVELARLARLRMAIAQRSLDFSQNMVERVQVLKGYAGQLKDHARKMAVNDTNEEIVASYQKVAQLWRKVVALGLGVSSTFSDESELGEMPPKISIAAGSDTPLGIEYNRFYDEVRKRYEQVQAMPAIRRQGLIEAHFTTLREAGTIRSQYINRLSEVNQGHVIKFNSQYISDLVLEVKVVPFRLVGLAVSRGIQIRN